jgi:hypothetical protein
METVLKSEATVLRWKSDSVKRETAARRVTVAPRVVDHLPALRCRADVRLEPHVASGVR